MPNSVSLCGSTGWYSVRDFGASVAFSYAASRWRVPCSNVIVSYLGPRRGEDAKSGRARARRTSKGRAALADRKSVPRRSSNAASRNIDSACSGVTCSIDSTSANICRERGRSRCRSCCRGCWFERWDRRGKSRLYRGSRRGLRCRKGSRLGCSWSQRGFRRRRNSWNGGGLNCRPGNGAVTGFRGRNRRGLCGRLTGRGC